MFLSYSYSLSQLLVLACLHNATVSTSGPSVKLRIVVLSQPICDMKIMDVSS